MLKFNKKFVRTVSNETSPRSPKFSTIHSATGILIHVDSAGVPAMGYLPQDIIGRQIFDFYHPADMAVLKEVYEKTIEKHQLSNVGRPIKSRPYRFMIHNGCFITLETEFSATYNPWSRKLNVVTGKHRVLQGK